MAIRPRFGFALENVSDIQTVKRFYVEVLGLEVERDHPTFIQFKEEGGAKFAIASDESLSGRNEPELYWLVDDAGALFSELSQKAEITFPLKQMSFGMVFGVKDPAGQPRYFLELAQDRPSRRV